MRYFSFGISSHTLLLLNPSLSHTLNRPFPPLPPHLFNDIVTMKTSYSCPNGCFGHGSCRNIREMGLMSTATPLVNATGETGSNDTDEDGWGFEVAYGWRVPAGSLTWDSRSVFGCVCDSSWKVPVGEARGCRRRFFYIARISLRSACLRIPPPMLDACQLEGATVIHQNDAMQST